MSRETGAVIGRREFLAGAASAATILSGAAAGAPPDAEWRNRQSGMTYRRLGRTGFMVSSIGMGGNNIRPDNVDHLLYAMDHGLNYVDTAPGYGRGKSEEGYAVAIKARGRDKLFVTSKVPDGATRDAKAYEDIFDSLPAAEQTEFRNLAREKLEESGALEKDYMVHYFSHQPRRIRQEVLHSLLAGKFANRIERKTNYKDDIITSVEGTLNRLGTDYLDCLLAPHGVDAPYYLSNRDEVFEAFEVLKKQGKVRFLGFSSHSDPAANLKAAIEGGQYSMALIAYNFVNHRFVEKALEQAREADFGVVVMKASRGLQNPFRRTSLVRERVKQIDEMIPGDLSPFQKAFQFVLDNPNVSTIAAGMDDMAFTKEDLPLALEEGARREAGTGRSPAPARLGCIRGHGTAPVAV